MLFLLPDSSYREPIDCFRPSCCFCQFFSDLLWKPPSEPFFPVPLPWYMREKERERECVCVWCCGGGMIFVSWFWRHGKIIMYAYISEANFPRLRYSTCQMPGTVREPMAVVILLNKLTKTAPSTYTPTSTTATHLPLRARARAHTHTHTHTFQSTQTVSGGGFSTYLLLRWMPGSLNTCCFRSGLTWRDILRQISLHTWSSLVRSEVSVLRFTIPRLLVRAVVLHRVAGG